MKFCWIQSLHRILTFFFFSYCFWQLYNLSKERMLDSVNLFLDCTLLCVLYKKCKNEIIFLVPHYTLMFCKLWSCCNKETHQHDIEMSMHALPSIVSLHLIFLYVLWVEIFLLFALCPTPPNNCLLAAILLQTPFLLSSFCATTYRYLCQQVTSSKAPPRSKPVNLTLWTNGQSSFFEKQPLELRWTNHNLQDSISHYYYYYYYYYWKQKAQYSFQTSVFLHDMAHVNLIFFDWCSQMKCFFVSVWQVRRAF